MESNEEILRQVVGKFLGGKRKPTRAKPHRCLGCGKVTRHIFCPDTHEACRALYHERQA